jgi:hypothetical protein
VLKGYRLEQFEDAFTRYLPNTPISSATPLPTVENKAFRSDQVATARSEVADQTREIGAVKEVRCRDCANFDPDSTLCLKTDRPVDPAHERICGNFSVPF